MAAPGATLTFSPQLVGDSAAYGPIAWSSSDTAVVVVARNGLARSVGQGIARVVAVAGADPRLRAEAEVTAICTGPLLQSLAVEPSAITLDVRGTRQIVPTVTLNPCAPASTARGVRYESSDPTVAAVSATGLVTARRAGAAVITVAASAATTVTLAVAVTVRG
jgi:uncharacterized protein YjdB